MPDYERIDKCEKDIAYLIDLYSRVVLSQEKIINDCAETFAVLASDLQIIRKMVAEIEIELSTINKSPI